MAARSSIEHQIDEAVARWVEQGLVEASGWEGKPLIRTPLPSGRGIGFETEPVEHVLKFFLLLHQLVGRWAGQKFRLFDWQVRYLIAPVFGIRYISGPRRGRRVIRTFWFEIPRKNGKSTLCSGIGLYLLLADREPGAQVFAAAASKDQAKLVFQPAVEMAKKSPEILKRIGLRNITKSHIEHPVTLSVFRPISSAGELQQGLNVHGAIVDEVHVHKNPDVVDALETGTGSREQPLVGFITTADDGGEGSVYDTKRDYVEKLADGTIVDETFLGVVFAVDEKAKDFDPYSDDALMSANPGVGATVQLDYLRAKAREAKQSTAQVNRYLRLHLGIRTKQTTLWFLMPSWDRAGGTPVAKPRLVPAGGWAGRTAYGGLDLSSTTDMTACVFVSPHDTADGLDVVPMFWLPEERAEQFEREYRIPFGAWSKAGLIRLTEGNVVDYERVRADIAVEADRLGCAVASIDYDPWNASEIIQRLEEDGFPMVKCAQGYSTLSAPAKQLERLIIGSTAKAPLFRHGAHPVLRWHASCVDVRTDDNGNMKPVKPNRAKTSKRIDGIVAAIMAIRGWQSAQLEDDSDGGLGDYMRALTVQCPSCGHLNPRGAAGCAVCREPLEVAS